MRCKIEPFWMGKCEVTWDEYEVWMSHLDIEARKSERPKPPSTTSWPMRSTARPSPTPT